MTVPTLVPGAAGKAARAGSAKHLLRRFLLLSVVSAVAILMLVGAGFYNILRHQVMEDAKDDSVAVAQALFALERPVLVQPVAGGASRIAVPEAEMAGLDQRMRRFLSTFGIVKIKVYDGDSKIVYSTDKSLIGKSDTGNARLERVLRVGAVDAALTTKGKMADLQGQERIQVDVVETYLPIRLAQRIAGSFEVYVDVSQSYRRLVELTLLSLAVLLTVLVVVFGVLYVPMRQGTMHLGRVQDRLRELAATDALTGLFNRRHLFDQIGAEFSRMVRRQDGHTPKDSIGFIMADIDRFKAINDAHGHLGGDEVLRQMAQRMKAMLRTYDVIGRYGGEEFLVMLPHTDLAEAKAIAERIRRKIEEAPFSIDAKEVRVTASFGVAHSPAAREEVEAVLRRADSSLYRAKAAGRNTVVGDD